MAKNMMDANEFLGLRQTEREATIYLSWFIHCTLDQYLGQNARTVISNLKKDNPPRELIQFFLAYEEKHLNRPEVIECLKRL